MRAIRKNHSREHPRRCVFVDTEATNIGDGFTPDEEMLTFKLACWQAVTHYGTQYIEDERMTCRRAIDFWSWLSDHCKPKSVVWLFAHNLWFDLTILGVKSLMNEGRIRLASKHKTCKACTVGSCKECRCWKGSVSLDTGASFASIMLDGKRVNCVDSFNYYRGSLQSVAASHGLEKMPMPTDFDSEERWEAYCKRDVDVCKTAICELVKYWYSHDLGNFQFTGPGLAFSCYRHRFMHQSIVIHGMPSVRDDEQAAYYGGQVSVFYKGRITQAKPELFDSDGFKQKKYEAYYIGEVWHVDCNSMYPYVMACNDFPAMYLGTKDHPSISEMFHDLTEYAAVASCLVNSPHNTYPFRCGGQVWYPKGRFPTTLCGPELSMAIAYGDIERIYHAHIYERKPLFKEWVQFWHDARLMAMSSGRLAYAEFCKLMMNSLGGKFAQRYRKWRIDSRSSRMVEWGKWPRYLSARKEWQVCRALGRLVQVQDRVQYADHALVAISAYITSLGRRYMGLTREAVGEDNVLYQDTDSLFLTAPGYKRLSDDGMLDDVALGKFKVKEVVLEGGIYGRQDYEVNGRVVKAGLPKTAELVGERRWSYDEFESPDSMMSRMPDGTVRIKRRVMTGSELCSGREYGVDGRSTPRDARSIMRQYGIDLE